jgi:hypothetical protein
MEGVITRTISDVNCDVIHQDNDEERGIIKAKNILTSEYWHEARLIMISPFL